MIVLIQRASGKKGCEAVSRTHLTKEPPLVMSRTGHLFARRAAAGIIIDQEHHEHGIMNKEEQRQVHLTVFEC